MTLPFVIQNGQVFIRDTLIQDGTISNAKIGNFIQSNNYVAGSVGWKLDKSGTFENYGSTAGEGAMKQTNQTISVKDGSNVLRVQVGRLTGCSDMAYGIQTGMLQENPTTMASNPFPSLGEYSWLPGKPPAAGLYGALRNESWFVLSLDEGGNSVGRRIVASGSTITVSAASSVGLGNYPASKCEVVVFMEKA